MSIPDSRAEHNLKIKIATKNKLKGYGLKVLQNACRKYKLIRNQRE